MKSLKNTIIVLLVLLTLVSTLSWHYYLTEYNKLANQYQEKVNNLQQQYEEKVNNLQQQYEEKVNNLQQQYEAKLKLYEDSGIKVFNNTQPKYIKGLSWDAVKLTNNATAHNPTWLELMSFLTQDKTDSELYLTNLCGWFAETVHNNAEKFGIKAAFVAVDFEVGEGHGLNAFNTVDKGLVYIDCTGSGLQPVYPSFLYIVIGDTGSNDAIAYVEKGKPYGVINIGTSYGLNYSDYEQWKTDVQNMRYKFDHASTNSELYRLKDISDKTLGSFWESGEVVRTIEIYW